MPASHQEMPKAASAVIPEAECLMLYISNDEAACALQDVLPRPLGCTEIRKRAQRDFVARARAASAAPAAALCRQRYMKRQSCMR